MKSPLLLVFFLAFAAASGPSLQKLVKIACSDLIDYYREDYVLRNYNLEFVDYHKEDDSYTLDMIVGYTVCRVDEAIPTDYDNCKFQDGKHTFRKCTVKLVPGGNHGYQLKTANCTPL
ncbi:uncharacterized protein LOC129221647 [Uloborus diversus]|uniref:uncharacterized protein LOC129221647 n=1 Tax=Uloborus diversus TaxID=327109 RepID=UPI00240A8FF1|nr:uncharacterized protein LOC129221647 [Uloborus diversus]